MGGRRGGVQMEEKERERAPVGRRARWSQLAEKKGSEGRGVMKLETL